jgi:hypothetical protein
MLLIGDDILQPITKLAGTTEVYAMHKLLLLLLLLLALLGCSSPQSEQHKQSDSSKQAVRQLGVAVALNNEATEFSNKFPSFEIIPASDLQHLQSLWSSALVEARKVDVIALNADEPGFGDTFQNKFIKGLELCTNGNGQLDIVQGQLLLDSFGNDLSAVKAKKRASAH